jgi:hypothetical protein
VAPGGEAVHVGPKRKEGKKRERKGEGKEREKCMGREGLSKHYVL